MAIAVDEKYICGKEKAMKNHMHIFGLGYTSLHLMNQLRAQGWTVTATKRSATPDAMAFHDYDAVMRSLTDASHIISSVPPNREGGDPVLKAYGDAIAGADLRWSGYLSSTGVYGDVQGAWVDESAAIGTGRRTERSAADSAWQKLRADMHVFRLPGIYGPGRSALERMVEGKARRIDMEGQIFSRIHVADIVSGICASISQADDGNIQAGVYNISDDLPCSQNQVIACAAQILGMNAPPLQSLQEANLSKMALGFYAENRRVANGKAKRLLGWQPQYSDYRLGLRACMAMTNPMQAKTAPVVAKGDH